MEESFDDILNNVEEIPILPGISQSIIVRIMELCGVEYEVKTDEVLDKEYPVIFGDKENIEKAKKYFILFTEVKLALRDIARLTRKFNSPVKLYSDDEELKNVIGTLLNDVVNGDKIKLINEKLDTEDFELINICGKDIFVFV
ncbi:hypothetical protein [Methanococcus aeolicus]|uniref:Uncharacterized protein n=1 Tax=Methanococcus aeolicus (strain ATCC BAA-1280 / DSM 17508 / OCM 812 / Nankai-3) TaxID=419665 RepID=A6UWB0_META3|nr:hypothetical protein [Methanococcus aeolicus]ABR56782.1 conserved hypothetical protein [Methanococcus aeolicus Nankai-3]UXM84796.1 hypothetical protein N6C89_00405 [Methanococcus aeolicus]